MPFNMTFQHNKIKAILVYLELKTTRELVGKLEYKNKKYCFSYDKRYLELKKALPIGPELPLTKLYFESEELFPSFVDRIPSKHNPAYTDYCAEFSIDVDEENQLILLATIGRKGPSSFIFEPEYNSFTANDLKSFRQELGLTTRDFAECFGITQATIVRIENGQTSGSEVLKLLEIFYLFPHVAQYYIKKYANKLHYKIEERIMTKCWTDILTTDEYMFSQEVSKELKEVTWTKDILNNTKIKNALEIDVHSDLYDIREAKAALFELRFAFAIHNAGLTAQYEYKTGQDGSSIDFFVHDPSTQRKWLFELTSLSISNAVKENTFQNGHFTTYLSNSYHDKNSPEVRDIIKAQNAIFSKICDEAGNLIKFPEPSPNCYNIIVVDMRSFNAGISDFNDYKLIAYGNKEVNEHYWQYWVDQNDQKSGIKGVFDKDHPDLRSKCLQERIHVIVFIKEKRYFAGEMNNNNKSNDCRVKFLINPKLIKNGEEKGLWPFFVIKCL